MSTHARKIIHALLKPRLPSTWNVLPYEPTAGTITKANVWIVQTRMAKTAEAPATVDSTTLTITLVEPTKTPGPADDALESNLDKLLDAIENVPNLTWDAADRATVDDAYYAYKITVTFLTTRKA